MIFQLNDTFLKSNPKQKEIRFLNLAPEEIRAYRIETGSA